MWQQAHQGPVLIDDFFDRRAMPAPLARRRTLQLTQVVANLLQCCLLVAQCQHDENRRALAWLDDDMSGHRQAPAVAQALRITVIGSISSQFNATLSRSLRARASRETSLRLIGFVTFKSCACIQCPSIHGRPDGAARCKVCAVAACPPLAQASPAWCTCPQLLRCARRGSCALRSLRAQASRFAALINVSRGAEVRRTAFAPQSGHATGRSRSAMLRNTFVVP